MRPLPPLFSTFLLIFLLILQLIGCSMEPKGLQKVVDAVLAQPFPQNELLIYRVANWRSPKPELLPEDYEISRGQGEGLVYFYADPVDTVIFIETEDNGHGGEFGWGWSASGNPPFWDADNWGEFWTVHPEPSRGFYRISYRLD